MFPVSRILEMRLFTDPKEKDYYKSVSSLLPVKCLKYIVIYSCTNAKLV